MKLKSKTFQIKRQVKMPQKLNSQDIKAKLATMPREEKSQAILNNLDEFAHHDWLRIMKVIDRMEAKKAQGVDINQYMLDEAYRRAYEYEQYIFEDLMRDVSHINEDDFEEDIQYPTKIGRDGKEYLTSDIDATNLEKRQKDYQHGLGYTGKELDSVVWYGGAGSHSINNYLRQTAEWFRILQWASSNYGIYRSNNVRKYIKDVQNHVKYIKDAINRSEGLLQNTKLYRGGYMDINLNIGDVSSFEGFVSTSYRKDSADAYTRESGNPQYRDNYMITILAPKGTRGVAVNGLPSEHHTWAFEHEYILDEGQKFVVVDIDHDAHTATVMLVDDDYE